jgi:thymidylate synthase ThyX
MLTEHDRKKLLRYVTNLDSNVFGFKNLPPVVVGALFGRYSRSELGARELLVGEFLKRKETLSEQTKRLLSRSLEKGDGEGRANEFYARVLDQYGDDSVAELGQTALAVEDTSNIVVKILEDRRIGLSPLEKSSRYVRFDQRDLRQQYLYYRDAEIRVSGHINAFETAMDNLFGLYASSIPVLMKHLAKKFPRKEGQSEGAYTAALRAQACDVVRYLLPMATRTNVGLVGNGRAFEYALYHLRASGLGEAQGVAEKMTVELEKLIPAFVRRARTDKGQKHVDYLRATQMASEAGAKVFEAELMKLNAQHPDKDAPWHLDTAVAAENGVKLIDYDDYGEIKIAAALLYEHSSLSLERATEYLRSNPHYVREIITKHLALRGHRTHKPGRALEHTEYAFEVVCDIGAFRDLHRHRVLTQQRKPYTTDNGYAIPQDIIETGLKDDYARVMDGAAEVYRNLRSAGLTRECQYAVPFGYFIRFVMRMNAREAFHLCELRSTIQGHPSYRYIAQEMAREIATVHPTIGKNMMITWDGKDELSRIAAEQRKEKKERERK